MEELSCFTYYHLHLRKKLITEIEMENEVTRKGLCVCVHAYMTLYLGTELEGLDGIATVCPGDVLEDLTIASVKLPRLSTD